MNRSPAGPATNTLPTHLHIDTHDRLTTTDYSINYYLKSEAVLQTKAPSDEGAGAEGD